MYNAGPDTKGRGGKEGTTLSTTKFPKIDLSYV